MTVALCAGGCGTECMSALADDPGQIDSTELWCESCFPAELDRRLAAAPDDYFLNALKTRTRGAT